jgi:hypothetical protein
VIHKAAARKCARERTFRIYIHVDIFISSGIEPDINGARRGCEKKEKGGKSSKRAVEREKRAR